MNNLDIPPNEQQNLLCKRYKIPPVEIRSSLSEDGKEIWDNLNFEYHHLHNELLAYFQGQPSALTELNDEWRDYLEAKKQWFLALYELLRQSWKWLTQYHKDRNNNVFTPGLLAAEILEADCKGGLLPAIVGRVEIAPRRNYELPAKIAKAKHQGRNNLDQLTKDSYRQWGEYKKAADLEVSVLSHCRYAATQDKYSKQALNKYIQESDKLIKTIYKLGNFRKAKIEAWENGSRKSS